MILSSKAFVTLLTTLSLVKSTNAATKMRFKVPTNEVGQEKSGVEAAQMQHAKCASLEDSCKEDCDCCGYNQTGPKVRCERRNKMLGYKCYQTGQIGDYCLSNDQCVSQKCENEVCAFKPNPPKQSFDLCPLEYNGVTSINGDLINEGCPCGEPDGPTAEDISKAVDDDLNTIYVNNWAIGSGIELTPVEVAPIKSLRVCTADDCPECDPKCYKIEGKCAETNAYTVVQEGDLDLSIERNSCVDIPISGHSLYSSYKVTFPCMRGGFLPCSQDCVNSRCQSDPFKDPATSACPNDVGNQHVGRLTYMSKRYDGVDTELQYKFHNFGTNLEEAKHNLDYMIMSWKGDCSFKKYDIYRDDNNNGQLDTGIDMKCFKHCGLDWVSTDMNDNELCMQGFKLERSYIINGEGVYFFVITLAGEVDLTPMQYGIFGGGYKEYDTVNSPVCSDNFCPVECKDYPMKVSEVQLKGKCKDI